MNKLSDTAPQFDAGPAVRVELPDRLTRSVTISDVDSERFTARIDTGGGWEPVAVEGGVARIDSAPTRLGVQQAVLEICDDGERCTRRTFQLTVDQNEQPTTRAALNRTAPTTAQTVTATAASADPDGDALTHRFVWSVNGAVVRDSGPVSATTDTLDLAQPGLGDAADLVTVSITARDGELVSPESVVGATVVSTAPVVTMSSTRTVTAGVAAAWTGKVTDADGLALVGAVVDHGDATPATPLTVSATGGFTVRHTYATPGTYRSVVRVTDVHGKVRVKTVVVTVNPA